MARYKHHLETDVLTAARERVAHVYDIFDRVCVMFSGGKDSMTTLELVREYAEAHNRLPVDVIFLDEEVIPQAVVDTVNDYRQMPWVRMHWFTVPLKNQKHVLGTIEDIIMWDPAREHVRPMPEWGIKDPTGHVHRQHSIDGFVARTLGLRGKVAFMVGIRASESLIRFRSVVNKLNENYICASSDQQVMLCKPIYDWMDGDVFKFLHEQGLPQCKIYLAQWLAQDRMRVATPLHAEARHQGKVPQWAPEWVDAIRRVFPDFDTQLRYNRQVDVRARIANYVAQGIDGAESFINDFITQATQRANAMKQFRTYAALHRRDPEAYPVEHFLKQIASGVVRKMVLGVKKEVR